MTVINAEDWRMFLKGHPNAHLLQTAEWGALKERFGWKVIYVKEGTVGAQILVRQLFPGIRIAYIPKGPLGFCWTESGLDEKMWDILFAQIDKICHKEKAFLLKVEPDAWESAQATSNDEKIMRSTPIAVPNGFRPSTHSIQPQRTIVVDLELAEKNILDRMKQKTRYNIGLARRKNVVIYSSSDIAKFYNLMQETGTRDAFFVHDQSYYQHAYQLLHPSGNCELFLAEALNEMIAGLMVFSAGNRAWYLYGASSNAHRELMPAYLLQWEAMLWAKRRGCTEYDLWGVPDQNLDVLEEQFTQRNDGLWGVYRFKRGFGGELRRAAGPWDRVYNPILYDFYLWWMRRKTLAQ